MMETTKLILQCLVILQVYQVSQLVSSTEDSDPGSTRDKVCLPYDKAELDSYLKKLDTPEVSISNTVSSLLVKDIESLPFGALSVDWKRLRLLNDLSTSSGVQKISTLPADAGFNGVSETRNGGFFTTGSIKVPDDIGGTTTRVRAHRSTIYDRNGDADSSTVTFDSEEFEASSVSPEKSIELINEIPLIEEVEGFYREEINREEFRNSGLNFTTTASVLLEDVGEEVTTVFLNTDTGIDEEIKPDVIATISSTLTEFGASSPGYYSTSTESPDFESGSGTTKRTVILRIGELFSSVPEVVEHHGDREVKKHHVSRERNFVQNSWDRSRRKGAESATKDEEAFAKTKLSVFAPFAIGNRLRNRGAKSRLGDNGIAKRGGQNTDTEKLFRWFYRKDQNPENSTSGGKTQPEIKCRKRV